MADTLTRNQSPSDFNHYATEIDQLVQDSFARLPASDDSIRIPANLVETWGSYWLQLSVPGAEPTSLHVSIVARQVTVTGTLHASTIEGGEYVWRKIRTGAFSEVFTIPAEVDGDNAEAHYDRGILTIRMPKVAYLKPSSVPIQVLR